MSFEERRAALLMLLPQKFREEVFFRIPEMQAAADYSPPDDAQDVAVTKLRVQVQRQAELMVQWSAMNGRQELAHMLGGGDNQYGGDPYWDTRTQTKVKTFCTELRGGKAREERAKAKIQAKGAKEGRVRRALPCVQTAARKVTPWPNAGCP